MKLDRLRGCLSRSGSSMRWLAWCLLRGHLLPNGGRGRAAERSLLLVFALVFVEPWYSGLDMCSGRFCWRSASQRAYPHPCSRQYWLLQALPSVMLAAPQASVVWSDGTGQVANKKEILVSLQVGCGGRRFRATVQGKRDMRGRGRPPVNDDRRASVSLPCASARHQPELHSAAANTRNVR